MEIPDKVLDKIVNILNMEKICPDDWRLKLVEKAGPECIGGEGCLKCIKKAIMEATEDEI